MDWMWYTPLIFECIVNNKNTIKYLIEHGVDINKEKKDGNTPLISACECESNKKIIVSYLIEHGADIKKENIKSFTILIFAYIYENENIIKYLV